MLPRRPGATGLAIALASMACVLGLTSADAAFGPVGSQQRMSFMGPNGNGSYVGKFPSVAYNPTANEYLVVWYGDDNTPPLVNGEYEIFGQRVSGTGAPLGGRIRVSAQGADGDMGSVAQAPSVAYNAAANQYLVVWEGSVGSTSEFEIWGRRLSATGERLGGSDDLRISDMGNDGNVAYMAAAPSVAADPLTGDYLVVWWGDDNTPPLVNNEYEIFGQRLSAAGAEKGGNDFRISEQGADGNTLSEAFLPSVAYNQKTGQYLVAWEGDIGTGTTDEFEIWAQRLDAAGAEIGGGDFQISDMGPDGEARYDAFDAAVAAAPTTGDYLLVWRGDDNTPPLVDDEYEIFGQRLTSAGAAAGGDFRISEQGADGNADSEVALPRVAYDAVAGEYLVAWVGEIGTSNSFEIWAQRLNATGLEVGGSDFQVSNMGPEGDVFYNADAPSVAASSASGEFLVAWSGDHETNDEFEVYGSWLGMPSPMLSTTDPAGPANENNPRLRGSVAPDSTVAIFKNSRCLGTPAVNGAPASALNGAGIPVPVADNAITDFSATATSDGRTSRCSNSISYTEVTPPPSTPPPSPPSPPPAPPAQDRTAPVVSAFAVSPKRVQRGRLASFSFRLSEQATARILLERALPGRRVGRRCARPPAKLRRNRRCTRFARAGTLVFPNRGAGANRIAFRGRIGRRALAVGSYRATVTATDDAGNRSRPRRANFRIVRR
jgi:hypothetical protein